jgi:ribose transport system substrate-binding protein
MLDMERLHVVNSRFTRRQVLKAGASALIVVPGLGLVESLLAACGGNGGTTSTTGGRGPDPKTALANLTSGAVFSKGPNGESAAAASSVQLSSDEIAKIKAMGATAAICLHYGGNDWSTAQVAGQKARMAELGINLIAVTDANFKPETQVSDIETVLARKPSIIISIPTDAVATAPAYKKAANQGVKLVFMDNVPNGFVAGKDYVSDVSADNYGNGVAAGYSMADVLSKSGKIGTVFHAADFFVTKERYQGFKDTITQNYPDIQIVEEQGIAGPDFAGDAQKAAAAILTKHPDVKAIWAVWDVPAQGVEAAARAANRGDLIIITEDLGLDAAVSIAKKGLIKGLGAQRPYDQGVTEVNLAGYGLLGKTAPAYVALSALPVNHDNVLDAWQTVYHASPPASLQSAFVK